MPSQNPNPKEHLLWRSKNCILKLLNLVVLMNFLWINEISQNPQKSSPWTLPKASRELSISSYHKCTRWVTPHGRSKSPSITGHAIMHFKYVCWRLAEMSRRSRNPFVPACQGPQQTYMANRSEIREKHLFSPHIWSQEMENLWQLGLSPAGENSGNWSTYKQTSDLRWHEYNW